MKKTLTLSVKAVGDALRRSARACLMLPLLFVHSPAQAIDNEGITIIADASLIQPLRIITQHYTRREQVGITLISDPRHYPVDRVSEGLSADMVITANSHAQADIENMGLADQFATKLLAHEPMVLLRNPAVDEQEDTNAIARSTDPTLVVLNTENFPNISAMSVELANVAFKSTPKTLVVTNRDEWYRALKEPNHFAMLPQTMRKKFPALSLVRTLNEENTHAHIQGDVLAGTRMNESRALLAFLAGPDAAKVWRSFGYTPESY